MSVRRLLFVVSAVFTLGCTLVAQDQPQEQSKTTIQHVPIKRTSSASGKEMYTSYCAVCHGKDGKGDGPAAGALKVPPADLTMLAKNNGGKYPAMKVSSTLRNTSSLPAHGSKDMPMWGRYSKALAEATRAKYSNELPT